ncbi:uncharacterized protein TNCV_1330511 [Trichonephila clavipes]|uniref:Mos1 transposase HTH domain-containing protein n=1 Tax=Trichonephila clavipes TaxID=2585209 RepID=A0A8X6R8N0_TRICX|nr:uncharacterized protein TNCV_1330511 [Trichonephila clavipes]
MEVTHFEQRDYIKIAILRERNAMECHSELVESLGNIALPYRTVARWIGKSQQGRVSTIEEQRSGRPASGRIDFARAVIEHLMDDIKGLGLQWWQKS